MYIRTLHQIPEDELVTSILPPHTSPFVRLFTNDEQMQVNQLDPCLGSCMYVCVFVALSLHVYNFQQLWWSFASKSEEEQESILLCSGQPQQQQSPPTKQQQQQQCHLVRQIQRLVKHRKHIPVVSCCSRTYTYTCIHARPWEMNL